MGGRFRGCFLFLVCAKVTFQLPAFGNYDIWGDGSITDVNVLDNGDSRNSSRMGKVLNFFPVPIEEECVSRDKRRKGTCLNTYECKIQGGTSHGPCALGFGVCCVSTCNEEVINNITYFVNPHFPDLSTGMTTCELTVKKIDPEIAQLRLDFVHFNLGQPNRRTGVCEEDVFVLAGGSSKDLRLCGINSGQHIFFDVDNVNTSMKINMNLGKKTASRMWEVRIIQVPFSERAPAGCLQYHTGVKGVVQTMNFADNGRHLADQEYTICMRQEEGMCTIGYEPCDENSFKIGPNIGGTVNQNATNDVIMDPAQDLGSGDGGIDGRSMEDCSDRITIPCSRDDFMMPGEYGLDFCSAVHCGDAFCPEDSKPCRIETSVTPFTIGVHFGPSAREQSPDENLGMCLTYEQLPCAV